jgi:Rab3 GTPase-activating protein catalytic subunit
VCTADTQHEDREVTKLSVIAGPKLPEEVHGAPPGSFVAQLAEIMAGIKTEQGMSEFWLEVIKEVSSAIVYSGRWNFLF